MITLKQAQILSGGMWLKKIFLTDQPLKGVCFDTRMYESEDIFVAIQTDKQDGHNYIPQLYDKPLKLILVNKPVKPLHPTAAYLHVKDTLTALGELAKAAIDLFPGKIVAVTGSSGKTTFKHWLATVLSQKFLVHYSKFSYNNKLGLSAAILSCPKKSDFMILEMGTNQVGEILELCQIARPHVSILLNVGSAHLGRFGSLTNTYIAKKEIFLNMRMPKIAVIPAYDSKIDIQGDYKKIFFGAGSDLYNCEVIQPAVDNNLLNYLIHTNEGSFIYQSKLIGAHVSLTISAIAAVAFNLGLNNAQILAGLNQLSNLPGRLQLKKAINGAFIIDDSYNANPESVINLLKTMATLNFSPKTLVLGDLAELEGAEDKAMDIFEEKFPLGIDNLIVYGNFAALIAGSKSIASKLNGKLIHVENPATLKHLLSAYFLAGALVAFKASRIAQIEKLFTPYLTA